MSKMIGSFTKVAEPLEYLLSRKQTIPTVELNDELVQKITGSMVSDDLLYMGSFKTESPSTSYEKNAYKQLKQKLK